MSTWTTKAKKRNEFDAATKRIKYVNPKNLIDFEPDIRGFLDRYKYPTLSEIKNAMLLNHTNVSNGIKMSYKAGGGSLSDKIYSAALFVEMNDAEWKVVIKKYGTTLDDILITMQDIDDAMIEARKVIPLSKDDLYLSIAYTVAGYLKFNGSDNPIEWVELFNQNGISATAVQGAVNFATKFSKQANGIGYTDEAIKLLQDIHKLMV